MIENNKLYIYYNIHNILAEHVTYCRTDTSSANVCPYIDYLNDISTCQI